MSVSLTENSPYGLGEFQGGRQITGDYRWVGSYGDEGLESWTSEYTNIWNPYPIYLHANQVRILPSLDTSEVDTVWTWGTNVHPAD